MGGGGEGHKRDSNGFGGGIQDKEEVSQRGKCKHNHSPVLVCQVMDEKTVWCWRHCGI